MSVSRHTATENGESAAYTGTCAAPSCWRDAHPVVILGGEAPVEATLCKTHAKAFLGVSS